MSDKKESEKIITDYEMIKYSIASLGSDTKLSDLGAVHVLFVLACVAFGLGILSIVAVLFPFFKAFSDILFLIEVVSLCVSGILIMISILVSRHDKYDEIRQNNAEKRKLQIRYLFRKYFDDRNRLEVAETLKTNAYVLEEKIAELKIPSSTDLGDIDYLLKRFSSELKALEKKKKAGWLFSLALTILTTGLDVVENIAKALIWSEFESLKEFQVDAIASGIALAFFLFIIYMLLNAKSNSISGIVVNSRNVEYAIHVLNDFKTIVKTEENAETANFNLEIIEALKKISASISSSARIFIDENRELLQEQKTSFSKVESVLNQIQTDTSDLSSEVKKQANNRQSKIRIRSTRKFTLY